MTAPCSRPEPGVWPSGSGQHHDRDTFGVADVVQMRVRGGEGVRRSWSRSRGQPGVDGVDDRLGVDNGALTRSLRHLVVGVVRLATALEQAPYQPSRLAVGAAFQNHESYERGDDRAVLRPRLAELEQGSLGRMEGRVVRA